MTAAANASKWEPLIAPLFVPASRPDRFAKAAASGADAIIIDLEDAVPPARKDEARANLTAAKALTVPIFVRINAAGTPWHADDLQVCCRMEIGLVCVPKVESVGLLDAIISKLGAGTRLVVQIETAAGVSDAAAVAAHHAVGQLAFGPADFFLDMGMAQSQEMADHIVRVLALASRTGGIFAPLDGPCFSVGDQALLARECKSAAACGAGGKLCIHPSQVSTVQENFLPSETELEWARRVAEAAQDGSAQIIDGRMIDAPIIARAKAVLELAAATRSGNRPTQKSQ